MKPPRHDTWARQPSGGPSSVPGQCGDPKMDPRGGVMAEVDSQITELLHRSTHDLRLAWRRLHRVEPPQGLSRDLLIRALVHQLQEQSYGGTGRALQRRLQTLAGEFEKGARSKGTPRTRKISLLTPRWREQDSNPRSPARGKLRSRDCPPQHLPSATTDLRAAKALLHDLH